MDFELTDGMKKWLAHGILLDAEKHIRSEKTSESWTPEYRIKIVTGVFDAMDILTTYRSKIWKEDTYETK